MFSRYTTPLALILISGSTYAFEFSYHGMIKPEIVTSNGGVASYGSAYSHVAPTNALRTDIFDGAEATPQQTAFLESASTSFQAAHSRFSLNMKHEKIRTIFEFDFIDGETGFTNQTAVQSQEPRLRLATIYYDVNDKLTLFGGQKWTTAAGIKSFGTYNWIGNAYRAGNSGFLAMEAGATYKNAGWSITGALTGKGKNDSASGINANELGRTPGLALDINYSFSGHKIGVAGHFAQLNFEDEPGFVEGENQDANLYKTYASFKLGDVTINGEYYAGQSLNNLNSLGVAPASRLNPSGDVRESFSESGFFAYVSWDVQPEHNVKAGYGTASVDSAELSRLSQTELAQNSTAYINYAYKVTQSLTTFVQVTYFDTEFGDSEEFSVATGRTGIVFKF